MKNIFYKAVITVGCLSGLLIGYQFILAPFMDLPDVVWAKCLLEEQCTMPLSEYRTDLDWDSFCIEYYQKTDNGTPCDYCNVVTLSKNNTLVNRKIIHLPTKEDTYIVHFEQSTPNTKQCFNRDLTKFVAHKTHDYGLVNYGVEFIPSPNP